jgi:putative DNA primase/helicase
LWVGALQYDEFADLIRWTRCPAKLPGLAGPEVGELLADHQFIYAQHWLAIAHGLSVGDKVAYAAMVKAGRANTVHPVRDYLRALKWDGVLRLHNWLQTHLGSPDEEYLHHVGRMWCISAVARVMRPGCQVDYMLVFEGNQGVGKSTAARILGGEWYLGNVPDLQSKDAVQVIHGSWLAEVAELDAFARAETTRIKEYITRVTDKYRPSYGRCVVVQPRETVFIGTTNSSKWNKDETGARRFWPVPVAKLQAEALTRDRDQLWAEAVYAYDNGDPWWPDAALTQQLEAVQEERYRVDEWENRISKWVSNSDAIDLDPDGLKATKEGFTMGEVLANALNLDPGKWDTGVQMRVGHVLKRLGYLPKQQRDGKVRVRVYYSLSAYGLI